MGFFIFEDFSFAEENYNKLLCNLTMSNYIKSFIIPRAKYGIDMNLEGIIFLRELIFAKLASLIIFCVNYPS